MFTAKRGFTLVALALCSTQGVISSLDGACTARDGASCDASVSASALGRESALVQVRQDLDKMRSSLGQRAAAAAGDLQLLQSKVAAGVRSGFASPDTVTVCLASGLLAVQQAVVMFSATPPQVEEGLQVLSSGLFGAILTLVPQEMQQQEDFQKFKTAWEEVTKSLPSVIQDVVSSIAAYQEDADITSLLALVERTMQTLGVLVTEFLPEELSVEVTKFLASIEDALDGVSDAIEDFIEGNTTAAVQSLYTGIRQASNELLPEDVLSDEVFKGIAGALDSVFEDLSETVLRFRQRLLEASVCWKAFTPRQRVRPNQCPQNHYWDGEHWCLYNPHASQDSSVALLETSVEKKRGRKPHESALPATCDGQSAFHEKKSSWCYKDCPYGTEVAGTRCRSVCMGDYSVDSSLMCGKSPGTVSAAMTEMMTQTLRISLTVTAVLKNSGVGGLEHTASSLIDLGVTFTYPACPAPEVSA